MRTRSSETRADIHHPHNVSGQPLDVERPFGIRVTLPATDPIAKLVGTDWESYLWYPTAAARDRAMAEMLRRHEYSRSSDVPTPRYEAVTRQP